MRLPRLALAVLAVLLWSRPPAHAEGLETEPVIGGIAMSCMDFRGLTVRTTMMTDLGDVGRAWVISKMPIIALDPDRLRSLPPKLQIFFYGHECAHHVLGHYFNRTLSSEYEADCWSVTHGRERGLFNRDDVEAFAPYFAQSRGSPFGHMPGPERAAFLVACYDDPKKAEQVASNNR